MRSRAFVFHMFIACDKVFKLTPYYYVLPNDFEVWPT